jgi:hypothetical protein
MGSDLAIASQSSAVEAMARLSFSLRSRLNELQTPSIAQLQNCVPRLGFACRGTRAAFKSTSRSRHGCLYSSVIASTRSVAADWFDV